MEKKKFELYTSEERENLLLHWWHYYGKMIISLAEFEKFRDLVKKDSVLMKDVAVISYVMGYSSQALIMAMRNNDLDNYFSGIKKIVGSDEYKKIKAEVESSFFDEVVSTFNEPEADIPMSQEEVVSQMLDIVERCEKGITSGKVTELYNKCLVADEEVTDDVPSVDFIIGEGIAEIGLFSSERLNKYKNEIIALTDELPNFEQGMSFMDMCVDKDGRQWADLHSTMDLLVQLGIASGVMSYQFPRSEWQSLPGGMPIIVRNRENDKEKVLGKKPSEYNQTLGELKERLSK